VADLPPPDTIPGGFNLPRYPSPEAFLKLKSAVVCRTNPGDALLVGPHTSHLSISQLNLNRFCHCNHPTYPTKSAYVEPKGGGVFA
jgi:hypothetical protein